MEIGPGLDICCADGEPLEPGVRCGEMGRSRAIGDFTKKDTDYGLLNIASGQLTNLLTLKRMASFNGNSSSNPDDCQGLC